MAGQAAIACCAPGKQCPRLPPRNHQCSALFAFAVHRHLSPSNNTMATQSTKAQFSFQASSSGIENAQRGKDSQLVEMHILGTALDDNIVTLIEILVGYPVTGMPVPG